SSGPSPARSAKRTRRPEEGQSHARARRTAQRLVGRLDGPRGGRRLAVHVAGGVPCRRVPVLAPGFAGRALLALAARGRQAAAHAVLDLRPAVARPRALGQAPVGTACGAPATGAALRGASGSAERIFTGRNRARRLDAPRDRAESLVGRRRRRASPLAVVAV